MLGLASMAMGALGGGGGAGTAMSSSAESGTGNVTLGGVTLGSSSNTPQLLMLAIAGVVVVALLTRKG